MRVHRPHGDMILRAPYGDHALESLERARQWFEEQPEQLTLLGDPKAAMQDELQRFLAVAEGWRADGFVLPHPLGINFVSGDERASPVDEDTYHATAAFERRAWSSYIVANETERQPSSTGLALTHIEGEQVAIVEMRPKLKAQETMTDQHLARVKEVASHLSPYDDDLLDLLISNVRKNGVDHRGVASIRLADIVEARDKVAYRGEHRDGLRKEARNEIVQRLDGLQQLWVYVGDTVLGGETGAEFERVFTIDSYIYDLDTKTRIIGVRYKFGDRSHAWQAAGIVAPTRLLQLDASRAAPAKKVGRYFYQRASNAGSDGRISVKVREVLRELRRPLEENNPQRGRKWLEDALELLTRERVLADWGYERTGRRDPKPLPRYGWWDAWLELAIYVVLLTPEHDFDLESSPETRRFG